MRNADRLPAEDWLEAHAWKVALALAAACGLAAWGMAWLLRDVVPGLELSRDRPDVFWETLRVGVLFPAYLGLSLAVMGALLRGVSPSSGRLSGLVALALGLALAVRWATPDMALDLSPAPDALQYSALASRLTTDGQWTIPVGPHELPSRFSPGTSLVLAAIQWIQPQHLGSGIGAIWLAGTLTIALLYAMGAGAFSPRVGLTAALLLASSPSYAHYTRLMMSEVPWGLLNLLALACLYLARDRRGLLWAGGFLAAAGMLFKPPHVAVGVGMGVSYLAYMLFHSGNRWRHALWIGAGFCAGLVPWLAYNRLVLGGWLAAGYGLHDSNQCAVDAVFGFRYLFHPPIEKGFMGNLIYYPLTLLGLEPRASRMVFAPPVALLILCGIWFRLRRGPRAAPLSDEARWLLVGAACATASYVCLILFVSWQDSRYLLPVLPLICLWAAWGADPLVARLGPAATRLLLAGMIAVTASVGAAILHVEIEGRRAPVDATCRRLASAAVEYDVLATDEDPVLLGHYRLWTADRPVVPVRPAGQDWPAEDPHAQRRRTGIYQVPYQGVEAALKPHLMAGRRVVVWLSDPHAHARLLDFLAPEYELRPCGEAFPGGFRVIRSRQR